MSAVRSLVLDALAAAQVLLVDDELDRLRAKTIASGARLATSGAAFVTTDGNTRLEAGAAALDVRDIDLHRMLGHGLEQAAALAELVETEGSHRAEVERLGALWNFGMCIFDLVLDRFSERAPLLYARVTPAALEVRLRGPSGATELSGEPGVDLLLTVIAEFFDGARALGGPAAARRELAAAVLAMYHAELFVAQARRDEVPPSFAVLRQLRRKSALPMWLTALLGLLGRSPLDEERVAELRSLVGLAGEALWTIDDLADIREDFRAGGWSRPLWIGARRSSGEPTPRDGNEALERLVASGVVADEAARLASKLERLGRRLPPRGGRFYGTVLTAVQSWALALPI
jgi:hypothetical protein